MHPAFEIAEEPQLEPVPPCLLYLMKRWIMIIFQLV